MKTLNESNAYRFRIRPYALIIALIWTAIVGVSLMWNIYNTKQGTFDVARIQAQSSFMKDVIYRSWNALHGGVYVPVSDETPPNPYLKVPKRDVTTRSGMELTLNNPAYMTRKVHEMEAKAYEVRSHITSLNPIRPANAPDPWETQALEAFKDGAKEASSVEKMNGADYMRLMRPLVTKEGCLKCHAVQGYKVGDIRGGEHDRFLWYAYRHNRTQADGKRNQPPAGGNTTTQRRTCNGQSLGTGTDRRIEFSKDD